VKKVAILGCGPAGLLCALAVDQAGHDPIIFSHKVKSVIPGSVYLHESVPGLTEVYPENHVQYIRMGTEHGYAQKVYGDADRTTGWEHYFQVYPSWNAVKAYDILWSQFHNMIVHVDISRSNLWDMASVFASHDHTISTLPAQVLCENEKHKFNGEDYWIKTLPTPPLDGGKDIVIYNGLPHDLWYRWSVLSGVCSIESTLDLWPHDPTVKKGIKATTSTCTCWPTVTRAGRWAEWRHGVLLNDAYKTAVRAMEEL